MLTGETIRDVGRALPLLASEPRHDPPPPGVSLENETELLETFAEEFRRRYDSLYPVIDRAGHKLAAEFEELNSAEITDPEGEVAEALEKAEAYFHAQRDDLGRLRNALMDADAPPDHDVFGALDRLDGLYASIVMTMQEVRWMVLIVDGARTRPGPRTFKSGAALVTALDD